jgi:hypothetical protein
MEFKQQVTVTGIKRFKGEVDGKNYDSFKVFVQVALDESKGTAKGFATEEFNAGESSEYDKWKHLPFPLEADATYQMVTTGKMTKIQIVDVKPRSMTKAA